MELYQNLPNFFKNDPSKGTKWENLRYSIAHSIQIGGKYKYFHHVLVALRGNYKVLGQNIQPLPGPVKISAKIPHSK